MAKKLSIIVLFSILIVNISRAQLFFNNGATIYVGSKSLVWINGSTQNDAALSPGMIWNRGLIVIASNTSSGTANATPGTYQMTNNSLTKGSGYYKVEQDWINDATFNADSSTVELYGNLQEFITSTIGTVTTFDTLKCTGTGSAVNRKKTLKNVDANVSYSGSTIGALYLNDRELCTDNNTMFVQNTDVNAVQNSMTYGSEGFVSSLGTGSLARDVNAASTYKYPTGSSLGTLRYRQVDITPNSTNNYTYTVRLANNNGTLDGYDITKMDTSLCKLNNFFYHNINRLKGNYATNTADIKVYYDATADGGWQTLAEWNLPTAAEWNNLGSLAAAGSPYSTVTQAAWTDANFSTPQNPIVLGGQKPAPPALVCANLCANTQGVFTATGPAGATYNWSVPAGDTIVGGEGTNTAVVNWGSNSGTIFVTTSTGATCKSMAASCNVVPMPAPKALFDTTSTGILSNYYKFTDMSTGGTSWSWDFGDGSPIDNSENPAQHQYLVSGKHTITEIVTNGSCVDTFKVDIIVPERIFIPNVFTPNKDGKNDNFYITSEGIKEFKIEIYNRWGLKIFDADAPEIKWDGRSSSGEDMSDGTYYFVLYATGYSGKDYGTTGFINLIR